MTTPNPRGYPTHNAMLEVLRNSIREKPTHWSYNESFAPKRKRKTATQRALQSLLS